MLSPLRRRAGKRLREPFGKAGLTVAVIALVFAMLGGAYAAGGLTSKQKKEVKAIAKGLQGTGPAGPQGAAGANGKDGANGSNGSNGSNGADGKTILSGAATPTSEGVNGDFYVKTGSSPEIFGPKTGAGWGSGTKLKGNTGANGLDGNTVLSGTVAPTTEGVEGDFYIDTATNEIFGPKTGAGWGTGTSMKGPQGSEGNIKSTLPAGITLKGQWSVGQIQAAGVEPLYLSVALGIPTSAAVPTIMYMRKGENQNQVVEISPGVFTEVRCQGGPGAPEVVGASGTTTLCIWAKEEVNWTVPINEPPLTTASIPKSANNKTALKSAGAILKGETAGAGAALAYGTWAVRTIP